MSAEENDLRSALESAYDEHNPEEGRPTEHAPEQVRVEAEATAPGAKPAIPLEDRGDGRRADGKFARTKPAADAGEAAGPGAGADPAAPAAPVAPAEPAKLDPYSKAPQSWKPGAREAWNGLPPDVRAEVHRREKESAHLAQESAQSRQVTGFVSQLQQKYAPALQAEGVDALTASANLMNLASELRFGTPQRKAQLAAQIIRNYGVDVEQLANVLDGQPQQQGQQQPQMMTDPRVDMLLRELQGLKQNREQAVVQKATEEVETFGGTQEFFEDVREDMADLLEVAARRGIDLSLEQAYERACQMQPEISKVLAARAAAKAAGNQRGSTQRAKAAASSVRGTPTGGSTNSQPDSLRAAIEAAIDDSSGR